MRPTIRLERDPLLAAISAAHAAGRLGYQLPPTVHRGGCYYRYRNEAGEEIGCCAIGTIVPTEAIRFEGRDILKIKNGEAFSNVMEFFDATADDYQFAANVQDRHDRCVDLAFQLWKGENASPPWPADQLAKVRAAHQEALTEFEELVGLRPPPPPENGEEDD